MILRCGRSVLIWLLLTFTQAHGAAAAGADEPSFNVPGFKGKWTHYTSPNFEIFSQVSEKHSREALFRMELIRAFFLSTYHCTESQKTPVTLYFFKSDDALSFFLKNSPNSDDVAALTLHGPVRTHVLLIPTEESSLRANIVLHEYIHHLVASSNMRIPLWMNEGFAEAFSTLRIVKGKLEVGRPPVLRLRELMLVPRIPLSSVVVSERYKRSSEDNESFYGKSWALIHYLYFGKNPFPPEAKIKLLEWYQENPARSLNETEVTFRSLFGVSIQEMDNQVNRYVDKNSSFALGLYDPPNIAPPESYKMRPVSPSEMLLRICGLVATFRQTSEALPQLELLSRSGKADARVFEDLGNCALLYGNRSDALDFWRQAMELNSGNPAIDRTLSALEIEPWTDVFAPHNEMALPFVEKMRKRLLVSIARDPDQSAAYETLAWVEAFAANPDTQNILLIQKVYPRLSHRDEVTMAFALISWRSKKTDQALALLKQLRNLDPDLQIQQKAELLLATIENRKAVYAGMKPSLRERTSLSPLERSDQN